MKLYISYDLMITVPASLEVMKCWSLVGFRELTGIMRNHSSFCYVGKTVKRSSNIKRQRFLVTCLAKPTTAKHCELRKVEHFSDLLLFVNL